ncbi:MAG TPA: CAP domain-containing protein [Bryobacteraceae bacterium]|nr:CAP domain-containing protein [Bryobacteraceae bacterium]
MTAFPALAAASRPERPDLNDMAHRIFQQINAVRAARGTAPLEWSDAIAKCARQQCARKEKLRFSGHLDPELGGIAERLTLNGVRWAHCGENLFEMRGYDDPVNFAVVFWWYSQGHQANLLNPAFVKTGVGVTVDADERFFVTQIFVEPQGAVRPMTRIK